MINTDGYREKADVFSAAVCMVRITEREFFIDNLLVRVHHIDWMTGLTGLAPWEF